MSSKSSSAYPQMLQLPVKMGDHFPLALVLLLLGFLMTCWFML